MVVSSLNKNISYEEVKKVKEADLKKELDIYKIHAYDTDIVIAIGTLNKQFESLNVYYTPIYLVKKNKKSIHVGVYEIYASKVNQYFNSNDEIITEKLSAPLFFSFVTKDYFEKFAINPKYFDNDNEDNNISKPLSNNSNSSVYENIPKERSDIFKLNKGIQIPPLLVEEDKSELVKINNDYVPNNKNYWIENFMSNSNYSIIENEGSGDCFFHIIRQAFLSIGQETTIEKIRKKLADNATHETYENFKQRHDMFYDNLLILTKQIKQLSQQYTQYKDKVKTLTDRSEQKTLIAEAKQIKKTHDVMVQEKKTTNSYYDDYKIMKKINNFDDFKKIIRTCNFWAEPWSISVMERMLNVKFIIFSQENYKNEDTENVLLCGNINDTILNEQGIFTPEFYIIANHTGSHYNLISYKKKMIYTFPELPYDTKLLIMNKCMEKNSGSFMIIPDFDRFKRENGHQLEEIHDDEVHESEIRGLFDDRIVFQFYSKSVAKPPGKGSGETIPDNLSGETLKMFTNLHAKSPELLGTKTPDWRKALSNFYAKEFVLDNHKWLSVEHYYQASKFKKNNESFYLTFSLDSNTELSKDPLMAKSAGGKTGKYKGKLIRPKEVTIDPDFFNNRHHEEMYNAQYAKFSQNENLGQILVCTGKAKLVHFSRGRPPIVFHELMVIREKLSKTIKCN